MGSRKDIRILFSISFLMAPQLCWFFQLLDNELVILEKSCFIHSTAGYPTGIPLVSSIFQGTCHDLFLWGSHLSS